MSRFCKWSLWTYRALLKFFPGELRTDFGGEMLEAFEEDLKFEYSLRGFGGALRVWRVALFEVVGIGLPGCLQSTLVAVPLLSAGTVLALQSPMLIIVVSRQARPGDPTLGDTLVAFSIEAVVTLVTAFVAVYRRNVSRTTSLHLG